ncbi:GNAT family N-acetyltransferase [Microbacterium deminutum]|uniref:GNAT family N-acetyltransferase n=2 Tax=Microbacterium deminutum TaxID=344164 RepID=A0ABP5BQK3_9MICO
MVGPRNPVSTVCWCLSHRVPSRQSSALRGAERGDFVRGLLAAPTAPGVLAYDGNEVVGWAAIAPRSATNFARSGKIPHVDALDVWSLWCIRTRPGHRGQGITHALIQGAVEFARAKGAPAVEGYPVDNGDAKVDQTMAYVGTRSMFEKAGFVKVADTTSVSGGFPRVIVRLALG